MKINLIEFFEETISKWPYKIAVIEGEKSITFGELAKKAKSLAAFIEEKENSRNRPIAIYLQKSIEAVVSDLAVTYSGNVYMNLDVKTPESRIKNIINLIQPQAVITDSKHIDALKPSCFEGLDIINIDELPDRSTFDIKAFSTIIDTDPYCIINTSGSTGTPKGVVLNHRSFFDFIYRSYESFDFSDDETIGSLSPIVFDIYVYELCMMMSKGSTIILIPEHLSAFPAAILKILSEQKVSFIFWVPTIMVNIANMNLLPQFDLASLKTVWFAGEVFSTKQFNVWRKCLPNAMFANLYGPIEITLDCVFYIIKRELRDEEPIPIGYPYKNTDILILDDKDDLITEVDKEGELCVRGTSLAMGYYNNPEKTNAAFVQNPLNHSYPETIYRTGDIVCQNSYGEIVFKGRKDNIIKHSGYRTDLGEIEHIVINSLKLVKNGCIVYNFSQKEITLFYESDEEISPAEFRKRIGTELPKYMIPTVYHRLDELKRNTNGKIDRLYYKKMVNEQN